MEDFININQTELGLQVEFIDGRYYQAPGSKNWFPGCTTILSEISKGKQYENWLKSNGFNADYLSKQAMEQGSRVHQAIQDLLLGVELSFGEVGKPNFTRSEWVMISRFVDFYTEFKPKTVAVETVIVSENLRFGSQIDYVCELNGELWLIDHKTGSIYDGAYMQVASYVYLWAEYFKERQIKRAGILHLDSAHRGRDRNGKSIQGHGWKLIEIEDIERHFEDFKHVQAIWERHNPDYKPFNLIYPATYKLEDNETITD